MDKLMGMCNGGSMDGQIKRSDYDSFQCVNIKKESAALRVEKSLSLTQPLSMHYKQEVPTETYLKVHKYFSTNGEHSQWYEWELLL